MDIAEPSVIKVPEAALRTTGAGAPSQDSLTALFPALPKANVSAFELPNGASVILNNRPGATTMSLHIGTLAGGKQDPAGKEGAAHLIEHMTFEGTPTRSHRTVWNDIQRQGGQGNAGTTMDNIVFETQVPNHDAGNAVNLFTDLYSHPNSGRYQLAREQRIVMQEMRQRMGDKDAQAAVELRRLIYGPDSTPATPIGDVAGVAAVKPSDVRNFTDKYFTGKNTVAMIDGDLSTIKGPATDFVRKLAALPAGERLDKSEDDSAAQPGAKFELVPHSGTAQAEVVLAFPKLAASDAVKGATEEGAQPDPAAALANARAGVASLVMKQVADQKLFQAVRERGRLTYTPSVGKIDDTLVTQSSFDPKSITEGVATMVRTMRRLPDSIGDADVDKAKHEITNQLAIQSADPSATATRLFEGALDGNPLGATLSPRIIMGILQTVRTADVRKAAREQIDPQHMKILASGAVNGAADQIREGVKQGGWGDLALQRVPFSRSFYEKKLATPTGPIQP